MENYIKEQIAEKIDAGINIPEILESILPILKKYPSCQRSLAFGGWAIQSNTGSYKDGWAKIFCPYNGPRNIGPTWTPESDLDKKLIPMQDYILPTEINSKPIEKLLEKINEMGFNPRRAKIIKLTANTESVWHTDGSKKFYQVRLHLPLITNPKCFFETDKGKIHMPADGSFYLVKINENHRVVNHGNEDRLHFVAHIWDQRKITENHQYAPEDNVGETVHPKSGQWI